MGRACCSPHGPQRRSRHRVKLVLTAMLAVGGMAGPLAAQAGILSFLSGGIQSVEQTFAQGYQQLTNQGRMNLQGQSNLMTGQDQQLVNAKKQAMATGYQNSYNTCTAAVHGLCASNRGQTMGATTEAAAADAARPAMVSRLLNGIAGGGAAPDVACTSKNCYGYNAGRKYPSSVAAVQSITSAPPQDFEAADSLLPAVKASNVAGLKQMNAFVAMLALPKPSPALPASEANTAAGKSYQAMQREMNAQTSLAQAALISIGITNVPNIPISDAAANSGASTGFSIVAAMTSAAKTNGTPGFVSSDQFIESDVKSTFFNPKWYASVASQTSKGGSAGSTGSAASASPASPPASSGACNPNAWQNGIQDKALIPSIQAASKASGIPAATIAAIMGNESSGGNCAANPAACGQNASSSATGPMQVENGAAQQVCQSEGYCPQGAGSAVTGGATPSMNYSQNIMQGALYLKWLNANYAHGNQSKLAMAYNQGGGYANSHYGNNTGSASANQYVSGFNSHLSCPGVLPSSGGNGAGKGGAGKDGYSPLLAEYRLMLAAQDLQERYRFLRMAEYLETTTALQLADDTRAAFVSRLEALRRATASGQTN